MRHDIRGSLDKLPRGVWLLAAAYTLASLWHFAHNAEYLAYYPNMPPWITREREDEEALVKQYKDAGQDILKQALDWQAPLPNTEDDDDGV